MSSPETEIVASYPEWKLTARRPTDNDSKFELDEDILHSAEICLDLDLGPTSVGEELWSTSECDADLARSGSLQDVISGFGTVSRCLQLSLQTDEPICAYDVRRIDGEGVWHKVIENMPPRLFAFPTEIKWSESDRDISKLEVEVGLHTEPPSADGPKWVPAEDGFEVVLANLARDNMSQPMSWSARFRFGHEQLTLEGDYEVRSTGPLAPTRQDVSKGTEARAWRKATLSVETWLDFW